MSVETLHRPQGEAASCVLEERLEHFVHERTNGTVQQLGVRVVGEQVILSGRAPSYYTKQLATHAVIDAVRGLTLKNNIKVA